jgi:hypothetical protein
VPAKSRAKDPTKDAKFIFKGTVQKPGASIMAQLSKSSETAIVRVDEILQAPAALAKTLGTQITVKLVKGSKLRTGEQVLFHANGWLFGDSVAVESVKQEKPSLSKTMLSEPTSDPTHSFANRELENRVADASMVIEGQVSSVRLPQSEILTAASSRDSAGPVSEHDPKWREAVINVAAVHKGEPGTKQVVVRFPSSTDVQWYRAPKFNAGDRGVWLLQRTEQLAAPAKATKRKASSEKAMAMTTAQQLSVYTALNPMDFQPANKLDSVAPVIRSAVGARDS